ncbi:MAG: hypothetical protein M1465_01665 [Candidatus Marsarchaeota archaeon]|nr:hypothetical protein [Candidatus Marsarchaeota archaeon]
MDEIEFNDGSIEAGFKKLAKVEIGYEELQLTDSERRVLELLGKASRVLDYVFMEQICPAIPPLVEALKSNGGEENRKRLAYLMFNKSPFDALDGLKPFVKGNGICRDIAVYPEGITAEELESAIKNGEISADDAKSYYTAIRRENGMLGLVKGLNDIEASGDYERAKRLTEKYCHITEELEAAYKSISNLPVEIMLAANSGNANEQ